MGKQGTRIAVLCEDKEHQRFAYRLFLQLGCRPRDLRFNVSPGGRGAADHWVQSMYAKEVRVQRQKATHQRVGLQVLIDADTLSIAKRHQQLANALKTASLAQRRVGEAIGHFVPKRHIETWVVYLSGTAANENDDFKAQARNADVGQAASRYLQLRADRHRPSDVLPSLEASFSEIAWLEK